MGNAAGGGRAAGCVGGGGGVTVGTAAPPLPTARGVLPR